MAENLPAPAWFNPGAIFQEVLKGKRTEAIAEELGVTRETLVYHLASKATEEWKSAQLVRDLRRKEEAEDEIDDAQDHLALKKAEAKLRSAQWSLERVCRRIYGDIDPKQETKEKVVININLGRNRPATPGAVIDAEPINPALAAPPSAV